MLVEEKLEVLEMMMEKFTRLTSRIFGGENASVTDNK